MKNLAFGDQDYKLWVLLQQVGDTAFAARDKELSQYRLSTMKVALLHIVQLIGSEATPAEISRWILRKSHSVSGLLDRMEKDGLIRKSKDLHKKNLVRVTITEKGYQALENAKKVESIQKILSSLTKSQRQRIYPMLLKLRDKAVKEAGLNTNLPFP